MLDQNDLAAIRMIIKEELAVSENLVLEETERTRNILEEQINTIVLKSLKTTIRHCCSR